MIFVLWVGVVHPPERLELLEARLVHDLVVPDDLDGHLLVAAETVPGPHHVGEHSLCVDVLLITYYALSTTSPGQCTHTRCSGCPGPRRS